MCVIYAVFSRYWLLEDEEEDEADLSLPLTAWYLSRDHLGLPHTLCILQCRKPAGHLCCKLYCFLFPEFLEIQRRNVVLS